MKKMHWFVMAAIVLCLSGAARTQPSDELTDITGHTLSMNKAPARIVSLIPSNTELLFAVGAGQAVVGVTNYCNYPPEVKSIAKVGDLMSLNLEKIVALKPDLVLATGDNPDEMITSLRTVGVEVFVIDPQTVDEIMTALITVGGITGNSARAKQVVQDIENRLTALNKSLMNIPMDQRPTVFVGTPERTENWTPGPGTFTTDIIQRAGGRNVADEINEGSWAVYTLEKIVEKNPDVILTTVGDMKAAAAKKQAILKAAGRMPGWKNIKAIKNDRIAAIPDDWLLRPGPRMIQAIETLAKQLHPTIFNARNGM